MNRKWYTQSTKHVKDQKTFSSSFKFNLIQIYLFSVKQQSPEDTYVVR